MNRANGTKTKVRQDATEEAGGSASPTSNVAVAMSRSRLEARLDFLQLLKQHSPSLFELRNGYRNWPSVGNKLLDLYLLFQLVLKNGGRANVVAKKLWLRCGKTLHLPKSCTSLSHQLRLNYEKYLAKIEAVYRDKRVAQQKRSGDGTELDGENGFDFGDLVDVYTLQEAGSIAMGYPSRAVTPLEMEAFPAYGYEATPEARGNYLDARNHILLKWIQRAGEELLLYKDIIRPLQEAYDTTNPEVKEILDLDLLCKCFAFLHVNGSINVGCFRPRLEQNEKIWVNGELAKKRQGPSGARSKKQRKVVVVGAGLAGLACASQLTAFGYDVTVLEARKRTGGRVLTDWSFPNAAVDVGAMLITGVIGHPMTLLCHQLGQSRHVVKSSCPLYRGGMGQRVAEELDSRMEKVFNHILDLASKEKGSLHQHIPVSRKRKHEDDEPLQVSDGLQNGAHVTLHTGGQVVNSVAPPLPFPSLPGQSQHASHRHCITTELPNDDELETYEARAAQARQKTQSAAVNSLSSQVHSAIAFGKQSANTRSVSTQPAVHGGDSSAYTAGDEERRSRDRSLQEALEHILHREYDVASMSAEERAVLQWHLANLEYGCATNLKTVSNLEWDQDDEYNWEGDHCLLPNGFGTLVDGLAQGLMKMIRFGANVTRVDYPASKGCATVHYTTDDSNSKQIVVCDAVVITVPLGVLQREHIEFRPALPKWKLSSMGNLGMGNLNKVILEFPHVFWDPSEDIFGRVVPVDPSDETFLTGSGSQANENFLFRNPHRGEFYLFWALNRSQNGCPIVIVLMAGDAADNVEKEADAAVVDKLIEVMSRFVPEGAPEPPRPTRALVSRWRSDAFAGGSYSFIKVGGTGEDHDNLAEPVQNTLFFAGEATSRQHPATTGGAFSSGVREAARIAGKFGMLSQARDSSGSSPFGDGFRLRDWRDALSTLRQQTQRRRACERIRREAERRVAESSDEEETPNGPPKKFACAAVPPTEEWNTAMVIGSQRIFDTVRLKECLELHTSGDLHELVLTEAVDEKPKEQTLDKKPREQTLDKTPEEPLPATSV